MKTIDLKNILENHLKFLQGCDNGCRADLCGANLRGVDLRDADLRGANLRRAYLCDADLRGAHLCRVDLRDADLRGANLCDADLRGANLRRAYLCDADLHDADLRDADLCRVDLRDADLRGAHLCRVDLRDADLRGANLCDADLHDADLRDADLCGANLRGVKTTSVNLLNSSCEFSICPAVGPFIGFKKCRDDKIVKLEILSDSKRCSATTRKCRCSKVKVISITNINNTHQYDIAISMHDPSFIYREDEIIEVSDFDNCRWNECSTGIHFFMTREEAIRY